MGQNGGGGGCLAGILVFFAFAGNAILITGEIFDEMSDNPFAILSVIIAIIADFFFFLHNLNEFVRNFFRIAV